MYRFITGKAPQTLVVKAEDHPVASGLVTGFMAGAPTNQGLAGVGVKVFAVGPKGEAATPVYEGTTAQDGHWGPLQAAAGQEYVFDLAYQGRHVRFYKAPIPRSTALLNLRFLPVPKEAAALTARNYVLVARPQAYFSRDRDPVEVDGVLSKEVSLTTKCALAPGRRHFVVCWTLRAKAPPLRDGYDDRRELAGFTSEYSLPAPRIERSLPRVAAAPRPDRR
jgi:hypothetical protein